MQDQYSHSQAPAGNNMAKAIAMDEALARKIAEADGSLEYQKLGLASSKQNVQNPACGPLYVIQKNKVLFQNLKSNGNGQQF
jgi:hypothetical protein